MRSATQPLACLEVFTRFDLGAFLRVLAPVMKRTPIFSWRKSVPDAILTPTSFMVDVGVGPESDDDIHMVDVSARCNLDYNFHVMDVGAQLVVDAEINMVYVGVRFRSESCCKRGR